MSKVLVTGANGLLATNVIVELLRKGYKVRGFLRDITKYQGPQHKYLELITGDITQSDRIRAALDTCDFVIHAAALTSQRLLSYAAYRRVNVEATESLIQLAIEKGIQKFIFVSSANAFGFGSEAVPGTEKRPMRAPFSRSFYALSKLEAQKKVLGYHNRIHVSVVNPTFMIGAYDGKPSSGQIILMGHRKRIIFCPPGGKNFVNVTDAASGVVAALEMGINGEAYLLCGENLTFSIFFRKLAEIENNHPTIIEIPAALLMALGYVGDVLRKLGIQTQLSSTNTKMLCINNYYSAAKAQRELKININPIDTGINDCLQWFKKTGIISS